MEFHEKLLELRKQKGLTQEELAARLYVSRTAVSKWESGRGYPNIESLKAISAVFSVTVDDLLSSEELLEVAEEHQKQSEKRLCDLWFGLLDLCVSLLLFLPLFATKGDGAVTPDSLVSLSGVAPYLKIAFFAVVIGLIALGVLTLALQACTAAVWAKTKTMLSLVLGAVAVLLFVIGQQPYAAVFAFSLLVIKASVLLKRV